MKKPKLKKYPIGGVSNGFDPDTLHHKLNPGEKPYTKYDLINMGYTPGKATDEYRNKNGEYFIYKPEYITSMNNSTPVKKPMFPKRTNFGAGSTGPVYENNANYLSTHAMGGEKNNTSKEEYPTLTPKDSTYIENKLIRDPYLSDKYSYNVVNDRKQGDVLYRIMPNGSQVPVNYNNMPQVDILAYKEKINRDLIRQGKQPMYNVFQKHAMGGKQLPKYPNGVVTSAADKKSQDDANNALDQFGQEKATTANGLTPSAGQYTTMATTDVTSAMNYAAAKDNPELRNIDKANAGMQMTSDIQSAVPVYGQFHAMGDAIAKPIRSELDKSNPELSFYAGMIADPSQYLSLADNGIYNADDYAKALKEKTPSEKRQDQAIADQKASELKVQQNKYYSYASGGIHDGIPTAEVEKQEVMRMPNGSTQQVNGPSHENGGVQVNLPTGTQIYSDRLKMPGTKKTFAKLAEKYKVNKEEKIINDDKVGDMAKSTAKLIASIKQKKLNDLFQAQESLKQSKVKDYANKMGVDLNSLKPMNDEPEAVNNPQEEQSEYSSGGIHIKPENRGKFTAYKERTGKTTEEALHSPNAHVRQMANFAKNASKWHHSMGGTQGVPRYPYGTNGEYILPNTNTNLNFNNSDTYKIGYNPYQKNLKPFQLDKSQDTNLVNQDLNTGTYEKPTPPPPFTRNYQDIFEPLGSYVGQNAGNIWDLYQTNYGKNYDRVNYGKVNPTLLDSKEAERQADMEATRSREAIKDLGQGAGATLSNLQGVQVNNTLNKAGIREKYQNINAQIQNDAKYRNKDYEIRGMIDEAGNKGKAQTLASDAIRDMGSKSASAYRDMKAGQMDQYSLDLIGKAYPDYRYDASKREWVHRTKGTKLVDDLNKTKK